MLECDFDALGCLQLQEFDCSEDGGFCDGDSGSIEPCGDVAPPCDEEGRRCDDGIVVECVRDAAGCFEERLLDCELGTEWREAEGGAFCLEPCDGECGAESFCVGNDIVSCAVDELGCLMPDRRSSCGDLSCLDSGDGAECTEEEVCSGFPACEPDMFEPLCEDGVTLIECRETRAGCFAEIPVSCVVRGEISEATGGGFNCVPVPYGSGELDVAEECDDGNGFNGDGCDFECLVEPDFGCTGEPSECFPVVCGDGIIASTEGCEDGNTESDDGCSATCRVELPTGGEEALMEGGLSSEDGTWIRPNRSCDSGTSERFYDAYWVVNPSDSPVVINIEVAFSFDVYDHLFDATFNPDEPTVGCLLGNDDDGRFTTSALRRVTIPADEKRVTVVWTLLSHRFE